MAVRIGRAIDKRLCRLIAPIIDGADIRPVSRTAVTRMAVLALAGVIGITLIAGTIAFLAARSAGTGIDIPFMATAGLVVGGASILAMASALRFDMADEAYVVSFAIWSAAATFCSNQSPLLAATLFAVPAMTLLVARHDEAPPIDQVEPVAADESEAGDVPSQSNRIIDESGLVTHAFEVDGTSVSAGERFIDRIHLYDRVGFLQAAANVRSGAVAIADCALRFDRSGEGQAAHYEMVTVTLTDAGDGKLAVGEPSASPDETVPTNEEKSRQMLALVSHELRTPLNAIIGFSDVLRSEVFGSVEDPRQREYLNLINGAGRDLLSLVNMLLDVSKIEAGAYEVRIEPFNLSRIAGDCVSLLSGQAKEKSIQVASHIAPGFEEAQADCRAVRQVIVNLMSNAIKFTPEGGCVTLETASLEHNKGFKIVVSDTGIGMTEDQVRTACDAFVQADNHYTRSADGTGLGLALTKGLVELHGGELTIVSRPEIGTAVTATFPHSVEPKRLRELQKKQSINSKNTASMSITGSGKAA